MNLWKKSLTVEPNGAAATFGHLFLRISAGLMIFYIHGWHKLEGWIAYLQNGTPWKLAEEVAGKDFFFPPPSTAFGNLGAFFIFLFLILCVVFRSHVPFIFVGPTGASL